MRRNAGLLSTVLLGLTFILFGTRTYAQDDINAITTAVPFITISPDARSGGMGDVGVSTSPDVSSMYWNPAKYAFIEKDMGFAISYSPWLRELVDDIGLAYLVGYKRLDDRSAIAASLRYFSLGQIQFTDNQGVSKGTYQPNEWAFDATYSRKFTPKLSGAVAARFIYSNLTQGQFVQGAETHAGVSVAADVSVYYRNEYNFSNGRKGQLGLGMNICNIGSKINYSNGTEKAFIPTTLKFGPTFSLDLDKFNSLSFTLEFNKLLVPTPPIYYPDSTDASGNPVIEKGKDPDVSVLQGMIQSFYDAPDGFSEELKEFAYSLGVEYWYNKQFAVRGGYFHESEIKGAREYFTLGASLRYNVFGLDVAYLIPTSQRSPLENTLRFTLIFDFDAFKAQASSDE